MAAYSPQRRLLDPSTSNAWPRRPGRASSSREPPDLPCGRATSLRRAGRPPCSGGARRPTEFAYLRRGARSASMASSAGIGLDADQRSRRWLRFMKAFERNLGMYRDSRFCERNAPGGRRTWCRPDRSSPLRRPATALPDRLSLRSCSRAATSIALPFSAPPRTGAQP